MFMLIKVVDYDITTEIKTNFHEAMDSMMECVRQVFVDSDQEEYYTEDNKGELWNCGADGAWVSWDVDEKEHIFKIVELPSCVVDLL